MRGDQKRTGRNGLGHKIRTTVLVAILIFAFVPLQSASAHSPLVSSNPQANDHLSAMPSQIELVFGAAVSDTDAVIELLDEHGSNWVTGSALISDTTVRTSVKTGPQNGRYEVRWHVLSHDGAKMSGTLRFTVGNADPDSNPFNAVVTPTGAAYIRILAFGIVGALLLYMGLALVTVYGPKTRHSTLTPG